MKPPAPPLFYKKARATWASSPVRSKLSTSSHSSPRSPQKVQSHSDKSANRSRHTKFRQDVWMITSGSSPPCTLVAMDSPLFYELQDHCHDINPVKNNQQRRSANLHLNLNNNNTLADLTSARGLAPIRVPPSGAVFGNAPGSHSQQQQQLAEASYPELADINTPEISLDLQVIKFTKQKFFDVIKNS